MDTDNGATDNVDDAVGDGTSCANCVTAGHGCTCASLPAPAAFVAALATADGSLRLLAACSRQPATPSTTPSTPPRWLTARSRWTAT